LGTLLFIYFKQNIELIKNGDKYVFLRKINMFLNLTKSQIFKFRQYKILMGELGEMSGFRERSGINDGLDEDYVEDDEQDEERRWLKVKKLDADGSR